MSDTLLSLSEVAHPGSGTDRLYVVQGSGSGRDRYIEREDLFVDQMPGYISGRGAIAHDTASPLDTTASLLVLDKDGTAKKTPIDFVGVRGYKIPPTGSYAMVWNGGSVLGSSDPADGSVVTGGSISPRSGITISGLYPSGQNMVQATLAGIAVASSSIVSSARPVSIEIPIDIAGTTAEKHAALEFYNRANQLAVLSITDKLHATCMVYSQSSTFAEHLMGQIIKNGNSLFILPYKSSGAQYLYSDLVTLRGAHTYVFLRFNFSGVL